MFWALSPVGEGFATIWVEGELYTEGTDFVLAGDACAAAPEGEDCSARVLAPRGDVEEWLHHRWWVRVRTRDGVVGWVDNTKDVLTGFDACG